MIWSRRQASAPFIPFIIKKVKIGKKGEKEEKVEKGENGTPSRNRRPRGTQREPKNSNEILQYYNKNNDIALPSNAWF